MHDENPKELGAVMFPEGDPDGELLSTENYCEQVHFKNSSVCNYADVDFLNSIHKQKCFRN